MKKNITKTAIIGFCLLLLTFAADAQKRRPKRVRKSRPAATAPASNNGSEIKKAADQVATQIKNISKFLYNLGGVARVIEDLDNDIAARRASRNASALNTKNKQAVVTTLKNLRAGLAALEVDFRTKPALRVYLFQIQGISDLTGLAEDQAADGQLIESGRTLLMVVEKLSDTLAALP